MKKAVGYLRVSTKRQSQEGVSLETQKEKIQAWATMNDYKLLGIEEDPGYSGGRIDNREGLQKAIKLACDEKAALVAYSLSRLSRSLKDTLLIVERLEESGADLVSLSENLDTTSASGKMIFRIFCVLNQFEREVLSERTSAALQYKKGKGDVYSPTPYGFKRIGMQLIVDEGEQQVVRKMQHLREDGLSLRSIALHLNKMGVPAKNGGEWYASTIHYMLLNTPIE
ncbi:MAG: recombinase family protein [Candidatus Aegiribacteria sp.]|nr:recombinase family protein [Candidatus Aegiribacteria sp.]